MKLNKLIANIKVVSTIGNTDIDVLSLGFDSRSVSANQMFFAIRGAQSDGHAFIDSAIENGAIAVICEEIPNKTHDNVCYIKVDDSHFAMGIIASDFYDSPSKKLKLIGVTGTNGKTTIATLLYRFFKKLDYKVGLFSTVCNYIDSTESTATHTTPDAITLNKMLCEMVNVGCEYCFMEVSSHAVEQNRIAGLTFGGGIFSNISRDHLDYHKTFEAYINAKKKFFDNLSQDAFAITNIDDRNGRVMLQNTKARKKTYALKTLADYSCKILEHDFSGMLLNIDNTEVWVKCIGDFNAYNMLAIYAAARELGVEKDDALRILSNLNPVAGRFEYMHSQNEIIAFVDYAHTPDALENIISTINNIRKNQRLITVVGCGGNRDKGKRPIMARIASEQSDIAIFTSDNPRYEKPEDILKDMCDGVALENRKKVLVIADRGEAIRTAIMMANPKDIVLVAGKGHEPYQEICGERKHFDDKEVINQIFDELKN